MAARHDGLVRMSDGLRAMRLPVAASVARSGIFSVVDFQAGRSSSSRRARA